MEKSPDAFRTISEVADLLETPAHVLRFWESRFPQIRPVKRAGGRRYYRPSDVALLSGIKRLLHSEGLTIRGVQKVLREQGVRHVMTLADHSIAEGAILHGGDTSTKVEPDLADEGNTAGAAEADRRSSVLILGQPAAQSEQYRLPDLEDAAQAQPEGGAPPILAVEEAVLQILGGNEPAPSDPEEAVAKEEVEDTSTAPSNGAAISAGVPPPIADDEAPEVEWLPSRLRSIAPTRSLHHRRDLVRMHADLMALRARLAESIEGRSR
jgi:DNA-binding transcriptional MerR regulator